MKIRKYNSEADFQDLWRIWQEIGWIDDSEQKKKALEAFAAGCTITAAEVNGKVESAVMTADAQLQHQEVSLPLSAVMTVTTSRILRKQGAAKKLLVKRLAEDAWKGAAAACLGIFDQGYYDKFGFGTGTYEHWVSFSPSSLNIKKKPTIPERLSAENFQEMHENLLKTKQNHGNMRVLPPEIVHGEVMFSKNGFGFGYRSADGTLTHHMWLSTENEDSGPYTVAWTAWNTWEELSDLLALLKSLEDQVHSIKMREPSLIQIQDFLDKPHFFKSITKQGSHENCITANAYWQLRMLDVKTCFQQVSLGGEPFSLIMKVTDPIEAFIPEDARGWRGCAGIYKLEIGKQNRCVKLEDSQAEPELSITINDLTRLWIGAISAKGLTAEGRISVSDELLHKLSGAFLLPRPVREWDF
ncbi:MAG: GNAT family N-acetyltransferase [Spirochaetia bacterium]